MPIQAITFDAANTLVHVDWDPMRMAIGAAGRLGLSIDQQLARESYQRLLSGSWTLYQEINRDGSEEACRGYWLELTGDWLTKLGQPISHAEKLVETVEEQMFGPEQTCFTVFEDVLPTLAQLREQGFRLSVISNWDYTLNAALKVTGLFDKFEVVTASLRFGAEKPDPTIFEHTVGLMGLKPEHVLHVGDDPMADFHGARKSGLSALIIDRSAGQPSRHVINDLRQLLEKL